MNPKIMTTANQSYPAEITGRQNKKSIEPYISILDKLELRPLDWMTIRDLLELTELESEIPLTVTLALMMAARQEGSLCLELTDGHIGRLVGATALNQTNALIEDFLNGLAQEKYSRLITTAGTDLHPLVFETVSGIDRLYFQKYYLYQNRLEQQVKRLLSTEGVSTIASPSIDAVLTAITQDDHTLRITPYGPPMILDPQQLKSIRKSLCTPLTIISGGPGTGKTSVMVNILRGLVRIGVPADKIALAAPTGRAAQRMTEALNRLLPTIRRPGAEDYSLAGLKGSTLHKWLRYRRSRHDFYYRAGNPLPVEAVIIDEVSMVDVVMLTKFLEALDPNRSRLVLMGDKDQLPSVEAGAVFAEMIPSNRETAIFKEHLVVLTHMYRAGTEINHLAATVNQGNMPLYEPVEFSTAFESDSDCWKVVARMDPPQWRNCLKWWIDRYFLASAEIERPSYLDLLRRAESLNHQKLSESSDGTRLLTQLFETVGRTKILTLQRRGPMGCEQINTFIAQIISTYTTASKDAATGLFSGAVIMVTRNDYGKNLFNGDMGVVLRDRDGGLRACFQRGETYHDFAVGLLNAWEPAFAVTVHKSQGSEFHDVLLVLPEDSQHRLLTREILYTGITRARQRVVIYGSQAAIASAVTRKITRQSGFGWEGRLAG